MSPDRWRPIRGACPGECKGRPLHYIGSRNQDPLRRRNLDEKYPLDLGIHEVILDISLALGGPVAHHINIYD